MNAVKIDGNRIDLEDIKSEGETQYRIWFKSPSGVMLNESISKDRVVKLLKSGMQMEVSMDGLRRKLASAFNKSIESLEIDTLAEHQKSNLDEVRYYIGSLLCVSDDENEMFNDLNEEWDNLAIIIEEEEEEEEDE